MKPENTRPPRLKDIAAAVGVSTMLVSIALRGMPGVSEKTRKKIKACANRLGYRPDPALSALADYRRRVRPAASFAQIAYVTNYAVKDDPAWGFANEFLAGAKKRGLEFGYDVVPYWLAEGGCTQRQASSILFNRGIKGLIIAPMPIEDSSLELTWKYFCSVAIGTSLRAPRLDYAAFDHHDAMQTVFEHLGRKGYRRIGFLGVRHRSARLRHAALDAYLGQQAREPASYPLPPLVSQTFSAEEFWPWYDAYKPDVIITDAHADIMHMLDTRGLRAPRDVGVVCFSRFIDDYAGLSAVTQDLKAIGSAAVDRLHTNLLRNAYGVPEYSHGTLLHGHWDEGATLRKDLSKTKTRALARAGGAAKLF